MRRESYLNQFWSRRKSLRPFFGMFNICLFVLVRRYEPNSAGLSQSAWIGYWLDDAYEWEWLWVKLQLYLNLNEDRDLRDKNRINCWFMIQSMENKKLFIISKNQSSSSIRRGYIRVCSSFKLELKLFSASGYVDSVGVLDVPFEDFESPALLHTFIGSISSYAYLLSKLSLMIEISRINVMRILCRFHFNGG